MLLTFPHSPANAAISENVQNSITNIVTLDFRDILGSFDVSGITVKLLQLLSSEDKETLHQELRQTTSQDFTVENLTKDNLSPIPKSKLVDILSQQTQQAKDDGYKIEIALDSVVTLSKDGYYYFRIDIPDELVGQKVSSLKLYATDVKASGDIHAAAGFIPVAWTVLDLETFKITDTLKDSVMIATLLPIEKSLFLSIAKILIMLLGGCEADTFGSVMLFAVLAGVIFLVKRHKKILPR